MVACLAVWKFNALAEEPVLVPLDLPGEPQSLDEASACLPPGAYTTLRTYQGQKALRLPDHLRRLQRTAGLAGRPLPLVEPAMRQALRQAIRFYFAGTPAAGEDLRLRLTIDLEASPGEAYVAVEPLRVPPESAYRLGVAAVTTRLERLLPEAKLTRFIERSRPVRQSLPEGVNEAVMASPDGALTEGLSSNFFAVLDDRVRTAGEGVLAGVTRSLVLDCIRELGLPLLLEPVHLSDLPDLQEAFLTSSSRSLLPVSRLDGVVLGDGLPGPLTRRLMGAFAGAVRDQVEPI